MQGEVAGFPGISNERLMEVRWGDCDAAGMVYYAKYFDLFTDGRIALLQQIGLPYQQTFQDQGIVVVAVEAICRYRKNLKPEEKYLLTTRLAHLTRSRMVFEYVITKYDDHGVAAEGKTVHAYVDDTGKPFDLKIRRPDLWERLAEAFGVAG